MTRFVPVLVVVGVSIAGAGLLWAADTGALPGGGTITWNLFAIKQDGEFKQPDQEARRKYLNLAHCTCAKADAGDEKEIRYDLKLTAPTTSSTTGEIWVGTMCDMDTVRAQNCRQLTDKTIPDLNPLATMPYPLTLNLFDVINGKNTAECVQEEGSKLAWVLAKNNGTYVYTSSQGLGELSGDTIKVDTKPPEGLQELRASGSENSIEISWTLSNSNQADYFYVQALCSFTDDTPVFDAEAAPKPRYQTAEDLCGLSEGFQLMAARVDLPGEDPVDTAPMPFAGLQKEFLCGEQAAPASGKLRIENLENGTKYKVAVLAIDQAGNVSGSYFSSTVTPVPVTDFWEDLQRRDGQVNGGCLLSTTYGDGNPLTRTLRSFRDNTLARSAPGRWLTRAYYATLGKLRVQSLPARIAAGISLAPLVAIALLWHLLGLPVLLALLALLLFRRRVALVLRRRRRRRLGLAAAGTAAALLLAPRLAAADDFTPYWEDTDEEDQGPREVKWQAGIRVGPYTPDIDLQFPQNALTGKGPYAAMFGTYYLDKDGDGVGEEKHTRHVYQVLPMLDVDRIVWHGFGQIGVGGSIGYMQKTASAYANGTTEDDPNRPRSSSAENTFRLIPFAATAMYRLTYADDRWGIPVIPYVRAGLSYYMWWIKGPKGDISKVCEGGSATMSCKEDKAYGGTPGVQVSAGLAIRAERIDTDAARSMRNSGLLHAGFYGEVFWGRVDGFGSSSRLWVGDTTWFAGANFEF